MAAPQDQQQMKESRKTRGSPADAITSEEASEINELRRLLEDQHDRHVHHGHNQAQTTKSPEVVEEVGLDLDKPGAGSGHTVSPLTSIKNATEAASIAAWHAVLGSRPPEAFSKSSRKQNDSEEAAEVESFDEVAGKAGGVVMNFVKKAFPSIFSSSSTDSVSSQDSEQATSRSRRQDQTSEQEPGSAAFDEVAAGAGAFVSLLKKGAQSIFGSSSDTSRDGKQQGRGGSSVDEAVETADDEVSQASSGSEGKIDIAVEKLEEVEEKEEEHLQPMLQVEQLLQDVKQEEEKKEDEDNETKGEAAAAETKFTLQGSSPPDESDSMQVVVKELPPLPTAPGMEEANFTVGTKVPLHKSATKFGKQGVDLLMALPEGRILEIMCSAGWDVQPVDEDEGLFDIFLPQVKYQVPGASVRIPPPHFKAVVTDLSRPSPAGHTERLSGDLILQNGKDILTVELVLPFSRPFSISASGWTRAFIGSQDGAICVECQVEIGMQLPKVPGLVQVMEFFVKSYATDSVKQIAGSLALGADRLLEEQSSEEGAA